jgi:hypothetical protein
LIVRALRKPPALRRGSASTRRLSIVVLRRRQHVEAATLFDDPALQHHGDIAHVMRNHAEVVADQQHRGAVLLRQFHHQVEHVALHQRVERRGRLVCDQQVRLQQHHRGQHDALAHAAGKFMRIGVEAMDGVGNADALQHREAALADLAARQPAMMQREALGHLPADGHRRIERYHRLLEHYADMRAANLAQRRGRDADQLGVAEPDAAAGCGDQRRRQQAEHGARGHGFARAGLADQRQHATGHDGEAGIVD